MLNTFTNEIVSGDGRQKAAHINKSSKGNDCFPFD
jgi:hypothetical protein